MARKSKKTTKRPSKKNKKTQNKEEKQSVKERETGKNKIIKAIFTGENITSNEKQAIDLQSQSCFGELKEGKVYYSFVEAPYLLEKKKLEVYFKNRKINLEKFMEKLREIDKKISTKYLVFKDMRNRGFIVKTALKFGAEFRVYNRGVKPGKDHARWILYPVHESNSLTWHEFAAKNRVAHSTRKKLLIGIVDEENDVTYYEIKWIKP